MTMTASPRTEPSAGGTPARHVRVAIIGTGFAGLGMAIKLKEAGEHDLVLLERATGVGGTWRDNTYPGCQCDVPSHLYSFSFAKNPNWSRSFAEQHEIKAYLEDCAERFDLLPHCLFGHEVLEARWVDAERRWHVTTSQTELTADLLISGHGPLSEPAYPVLPGLETFAGTTFHSATWDHDHDLAAERVAVIGTGASAIQFVPAIQPKVGALHLFQRTPAWVIPRADRPISSRTKRLLRRVPALQQLARGSIYWARELFVIPMAKVPKLMAVPQKAAVKHLAEQIEDPALRAKLTPSFSIGCKRVLLSNEYYPALNQPNVEVHTDAIAEVRPHAIVTAAGDEVPVDTIIFGTGFRVTDHPIAQRIVGRGGRRLADRWVGGMEAHLGATVDGFPNFFMIVGPNTGLGHSSMVVMMEAHFAYILDAIATMRQRGAATFEVKAEAQAAYNDQIQRDLAGTIWSSGCSSWYLGANGRNSSLWPTFTSTFKKRTARFDAENYELTTAPATVPA